ncbi:hypothetical protein ASG25_09280 [Rhizobium sp. Leaf384]|uniref:hypothetical protein n=1 Tax=Rhizobium sp. Leaf384 TaxID=1736358 RepID=UPI0007132FA0|nr:hypothetical protein [Rhizobium sp. Leaf384]KQS78819.1 hypothetical protein ASG25_09280 [Rhizobium sp. Leaf384]
MNANDKSYLYLVLGELVFTSVPVDGDLDEAIVSLVGRFAKLRGTALWIEDTAEGRPQTYRNSAIARAGLRDNQTVVDVYLRSDRNPTDDYVGLASDETAKRFSLVLANAEAEYSEALGALKTEVATRVPRDDDSIYDIQECKDAVVAAGKRAAGAHPPLVLDYHSDIDTVLAESAWRVTGSRIASRVSGLQIGVMTSVHEWEMLPAVRFMFRQEDEMTWRDAYAFVHKQHGEWKIAPREVSWLQERKRQYRVNDAQIGVIHQLLEELGIRDE